MIFFFILALPVMVILACAGKYSKPIAWSGLGVDAWAVLLCSQHNKSGAQSR